MRCACHDSQRATQLQSSLLKHNCGMRHDIERRYLLVGGQGAHVRKKPHTRLTEQQLKKPSLFRTRLFIFSSFSFSSLSPNSNPSPVEEFSFFPSNSLCCCTAYLSTGFLFKVPHVPSCADFSRTVRRHDGNALAGDVISVVLPFLHAVDVFLHCGTKSE